MEDSSNGCLRTSTGVEGGPEVTPADLAIVGQASRGEAKVRRLEEHSVSAEVPGTNSTISSKECTWIPSLFHEGNIWQDRSADCQNGISSDQFAPANNPLLSIAEEKWRTSGKAQTVLTAASTFVCGAWGLVMAQVSNSKIVSMHVSATKRSRDVISVNREYASETPNSILLDLSGAQKISVYLATVQQEMKELDLFTRTTSTNGDDESLNGHQTHGVQISSTFEVLRAFQARKIVSRDNTSRELDLCELILQISSTADRINITALFDTLIIEGSLVDKLLERLKYVLRQIESTSQDPLLADIETSSGQELAQIWQWNHKLPVTIERCIHDVITERAHSQPDAFAICAWDGELTYKDFDHLTTMLANKLMAFGVGPNTIVPLYFEKSLWASVAMLGVLKAGGAFAVLDQSLPEQRLRFIVEEVKANLVLSSISTFSFVSQIAPQVLAVGPDLTINSDQRSQQCISRPSSLSSAYICFTSGSSGTPKGVIISHTNLSSAVHHQASLQGFLPTSRVFDFASYGYITSLSGTFMTLATGGCLCVPSEDDRRVRLAESIRDFKANTIILTRSVAQLLSPDDVPTLKTLIFAGEALHVADARRWWDKLRVLNRYGISECTAACTINDYATTPHEATRMGKGIGVVTWVVDQENHNLLLPPGCIGELLVEGPPVSRGYLNDVVKSATVFIKDPTWLLEGAPGFPGRCGRLYKTGDLARFEENGSLTFIGRKDALNKIRGQRVELGDVEHHIQECMPEAIRVVADIITPTGANASPALAAFIQLSSTLRPASKFAKDTTEILSDTTALEAELVRRLPTFMVPTVFFSLSQMPVTATGKIQRLRLREMGASFSTQQLADLRTNRGQPKRQPETKLEISIQKIWAQALSINITGIGLDDSFFHLGGDSIAAMKTVSMAYRDGVELDIGNIFRYPKLCDLAGQSTYLLNKASEAIAPFELLGETFDKSGFLRDVSEYHQIDSLIVRDAYPSTPLQQGLIALTSKQPGDYLLQNVLEVASDVSVERMCKAWEEVARVTPALRTRLVQHGELGLIQVILDENVRWNKTEMNLEAFLKFDKTLPMDLGAPLTRYTIVKNDAESPQWLVWTVHHALYDGWAKGLITDAVWRVYNDDSLEQGAQFNSFVKYIRDQDDNKIHAYWSKALASCESVPFPTLPPSITQPVVDENVERSFSRTEPYQRDVTLSSLIRATWAFIFARITNAKDAVFGCVLSGRNAPIVGVERMIAPAFATVPLRIQPTQEMSVIEYLTTAQQQSIEMIPFEQTGLNRISRMSAHTQRICMFQTLLVIQPQGTPSTSIDGSSNKESLGVWHDEYQQQFHTYALVLEVKIGFGKTHKINAMYDSRALSARTVLELLERFEFVLQQLDSANTNTKLADIKIVLPQDLQQIWTWNKVVPKAREQCVHELFEDRARSQPSAPAIHSWDGDLTYGKLDRLAAQLAGRLIHLGIAPGKIVPLCFEKSMWTVVAALGVLKAGGGFILLDPSLPMQRLKAMVQQLNPIMILSSSSNEQLGSHLCETVLSIGTQSMNALGPVTSQNRQSQPSSVMYAIFTSGSTGVPKGCMLSHTNFCSAFAHQAQHLGFSTGSRVFDFASYSFDVAVHNLFTTLLAGGCLCIPSETDRWDIISQAITDMAANLVNLTPSVAQFIDPQAVPQLQTLLLAGEAASNHDISRWWGRARVINTYGPAECTSASLMNCSALNVEESTYLGTGAGQNTWVVDPENDQSLLPPGFIGELLLEGPLVGCGYLNDLQKTASAFIENPAWLLQGAPNQAGREGRLYKTGDLVRYTADGRLIFVCRKDNQAKIYGQRIELGEVDFWVRCCVADEIKVGQIVTEIILPQGQSSNPTLVTFLETKDEFTGDSAEKADMAIHIMAIPLKVEDKLAQHLATYMMPKLFFCLNQLPMTATGKLDRRQLREIGASFSVQQLVNMRTAAQGPKRQPTSEFQVGIHLIWSRILDINPDLIGLDDSFFLLGGDSISAMKVVGEARKIGLKLSVADFFRHPKLHDLAEQAINIRNNVEKEIAPFSLLGQDVNLQQAMLQDICGRYRLDLAAVSDAYPCTPLQEGLMSLTSKRSGDYVAQHVLELSTNVNLHDVRLAWEQVVRSVPILRTRFVHSDLGFLQIVLEADIQWICASNLDEYLKSDRSISMDLGDPLTRYAVVVDDAGPKWLIWTIHHGLYDGWSRDLVLQKVDSAFAGKSINPDLRFKSFIKYIQEQNAEKSRRYWQEVLADYESIPFPSLPSSIQHPLADQRIEHRFSRPDPIQNDITTPTLFRAAWAVIASRMSNSQDIVFGATVSGRNASVAGIDEMTGPTIAAVPIRVQLLKDQGILEFLQSVQQQATEMIAFEQTGLQIIAKTCPGAQRACSFQTQLVIQPQGQGFGQNALGSWQGRTPKHAFNTFALVLELWLGPDTVSASAMFDPHVIAPWIVQGLLEQLEFTAQQLSADLDKRLSEMKLITQQDLNRIWRWNAIVPPPVQQDVHQMIARWVQVTPNAPAIYAWDGSLSYVELNQLASKLANKLVNLIGTDTIVPLCFEKSIWTSVAVLGVIKANRGFVLLDPSLPEERLRNIVRQTKGRIIVSSPLNRDLSSRLGEKTVILDAEFLSRLDSQPPPATSPKPSSILYIIFTSGSMGIPKGVTISYSNIASALYYQIDRYGLTTSTRMYDFASYSFDASINNILMTLAAGGCLCVPSDADRKDNLEQSLVTLRANSIDITPSVSRLISPAKVPDLRLIIFAGETLRTTDIDRWWGKVQLCNAYGPCECTTTSTINRNPSSPEDALQIGRGAGLITWVVDPEDYQSLLPPGCIGELVLEGPLVGCGYLNETQNVATFIQDPVWLLQGAGGQSGRHGRLYKTGDLVRYNEKGYLSFIGRKDSQVKIRGQRVELGEIEQVMREHEYVDDAAVVLQRESEQNVKMVGFAVLRNSEVALEVGPVSSEEAQHVEQWKKQFDSEIFSPIQGITSESLGKDFIGWTSMYDGSAIDKGEMNEWLEDTIRTILDNRQPGHVLEIGTGSGMILFNITEGLQSYVGLEPSEQVANFVSKTARSIPGLLGKVKMITATAADLGRLDTRIAPELVILNSVVQYFPSQAYLFRVVKDLLQLEGVKTLFFGDIRSYAVHRDFLASRAAHITAENASKNEIKQIIDDMELAESELLVDPAFFTSLLSRLPDRIEHIEILPKRMRATNELSCYRYAAVVHVKTCHQQTKIQEIDETRWIDFKKEDMDHQSLLRMLRCDSTSFPIGISNIPCSRIIHDNHIRQSIDDLSNHLPAHSGWFSTIHQNAQRQPSLSAVDLVDLARQAGIQVEISWARQCTQNGGLDAIFHRLGNGGSRVLFRFPSDYQGRPNHSFTNQPLRQQWRLKGQEQLDKQLRTNLPSYMVPDSIVILQEMPINANGKIDRRALARKTQAWTTGRKTFRPPTSENELKLQAIWSRVLGVKPTAIGVDDRFFQLGGDSIAAMNAASEARKIGIRVSVAQIFRHPSLQDLARQISSSSSLDGITEKVPPFTLLGNEIGIPSFIEDISSQYHLDAATIQDAYPCTPLQAGLMSLTLKRSGAYIAQNVFELSSDTHTDTLRNAWEYVARIMPILRTRFIQHSKAGLLQVIIDENIHWIDTIELDTYLRSDRESSMDLGKSLTRFAFVRDCSKKIRWFVWTVHHGLYDGWSMSLIAKAVRQAFLQIPIREATEFPHFIRYLQGQNEDDMVVFWRTYMANYESAPYPILPSSIDQPIANKVVQYEVAQRDRRSTDITDSTLIRAAWALIAAQMADSVDTTFGVTVSGRHAPLPGIETIAAPTFATIPIRVKIDRGQKVVDYLNMIQQQAADIIPFEQAGLQRIAKISAECKKACSFQTLLVVQPPQDSDILSNHGLPGKWQSSDQHQWLNIYALMLEVKLEAEKIHLKASFDERVLQPWLVLELLKQLEFVMCQLDDAAAQTTLNDVTMLMPHSSSQIWEWNSISPSPIERCVHDMFYECAKSQPNAPAICAWDGNLTYSELNELSAKLATDLRDRGIKEDILVPLCFDKSMWTTVAALGVLKAGGAFVLLDPSLPEQRLQDIIQQSNISLILSSHGNQNLSSRLCETVITVGAAFIDTIIPAANGTRHLRSSSVFNKTIETAANETRHLQSSSAMMYVIFTSGSTGTPKGVILSHSNFSSGVYYQAKSLGFSNTSRVYDFASYAFDISVHNIFATLLLGGCLCVPSEDNRKNHLDADIANMGATLINLTPSVARLINPDRVPQLKTLILAGEAVHNHDVMRWWGKAQVINAYGPAECGISTINSESDLEKATNIGKGVGLVTWIVDPQNHHTLLPPGCVGELLLEGPLVGCGYLDDPQKTALAFFTDPLWLVQGTVDRPGRSGRVVYKTGDLVQYQEDGELAYIGRKDSQAKIHGQRIELAEIEYWLRTCLLEGSQELTDIVVEIIPAQAKESSPTLVAFLEIIDKSEEMNNLDAPSAKIVSLPEGIEARLAQHLPQYMIPAVVFSMRRLPVTITGKIDRKILRDIGGSFATQELYDIQSAKRPPKRQPISEVELQMQKIWSQILHIDLTTIGRDDNFFRLGGDSIAAMKLVSEASKMGIKLSVADIFRHPKLLDCAERDKVSSSITPEDIAPFSLLGDNIDITSLLQNISQDYGLDKSAIQDLYPCTPLQEGLITLTLKRPGDYVAQNVLELPSEVDIEKLQVAWQRVAHSIPILRTMFVQQSNMGLLSVVIDEAIQWTEANNLDEYLNFDSTRSMDLGTLFMRLGVVKGGIETSSWLIWTVHHALYDRQSMDRVMDAVHSAYRGEMVPRSIPFQGFVKFIKDRDDKEVNLYWQQTLEDCECTPFPALPPSLDQVVADNTIETSFPYQRLNTLGLTTSVLVHAAWALIIGRMTDVEDIIFGVTVSGRNAPVIAINEMAGPTIATVPMRIRPIKSMLVSDYLNTIYDQTTEMINFEQTGLQNIAKISSGARRACMFQTHFITQPGKRDTGSKIFGKWRSGAQPSRFNTYALTIELWLESDRISASAMFDPKVIAPWIVQGLLQRLEFVLQQFNDTNSTKTLREIKIATPHDLGKIWNCNAKVPPPADQTVHQMIAKWFRTTPNAPAICAFDGELTYREMDNLTTKLANELVEFGVKMDTIIPICFEKSMWTAIAMIGILKANAGFVLLDATLPEQRLQHIVRQTKSSLILSSQLNQNLGSRLCQTTMIVNRSFFTDLKDQKLKSLCAPHPSSILYVVFTSGSTGMPKGVAITYSNTASALHYQIQRLGLTVESRMFDFASYSVDVAISNALTTFAAGGCLCIPSDEDRKTNLEQSIVALQANTFDLTPSVAQLINPDNIPEVHSMIFGGEALRTTEVERWSGRARQICNAYGATECTMNSTINSNARDDTNHIGKGAGLVTWIVNPEDDNELLVPGSTGELLLEGPLVGHSYLNDERKTSLAFIKAPDWLLQGITGYPGRYARLYKTGDLVRYTESGDLCFVGRKDTQIKIYGQRVELSEVEYWVHKFVPEGIRVSQVVAEIVLPKGGESTPKLVAFLQVDNLSEEAANDDTVPEPLPMLKEVEDRLGQHLPQHMIPKAQFQMKWLPVLSTGKTDRKRLRQIGASVSVERFAMTQTAGSGSRQPPMSIVEQCLQGIWSRLLNLSSTLIGREDSFFHLGGDSVTAIRTIGEARSFGMKLTTADVFLHPRLCDLAKKVVNITYPSTSYIEPYTLCRSGMKVASLLQDISTQYSLDPTAICDVFPTTPLQEGLIALSSKRSGDYMTQNVFKLTSKTEVKNLCIAWEKVNFAMPILRTQFVQHDDVGLVQVILNHGIHWLNGSNLEDYLRSDRNKPMRVGEPLVRYALVEDSDSKYFVWTIHHGLYDGWSIGLILEALNRVIQGKSNKTGAQFQSFIKYISEQDRESATDYWRQAFMGYSSTAFPTLPSSVKEPVTDKVLKYKLSQPRIQGKDVTISTLIKAAWAIVASRMMDTEDVVFGLTVSGRDAPLAGIESIAAPTFATVPVRIRATGKHQIVDFLNSVQQQAVEMIPFEQTGLRRIASVSPEAENGCKFQSLLVIQPQQRRDSGTDTRNVLGQWQSNDQQRWLNNYALMLEIELGSEGLDVIASFDTRTIEPWMVEGLLKRLDSTIQQLERASANAQMKVADIESLIPHDLEQIWKWNEIAPSSTDQCAHDIFRERVLLQPSASAICAWDGKLSYQDLDELSTRLMGKLKNLGVVESGTLVPICIEKSMWTPVVALSVLKAGGGFVLLDCALPEQRLQSIVNQLNSAFILSSTSNSQLSARLCKSVIQISPQSVGSIEPIQHSSQPTQLSSTIMYAIFTSGTTGTPKGVVHSHRNFCSGWHHQSKMLGFNEDARVFDFASYSFDISVHNIFATLLSGGCLCIPSERDRRDDVAKALMDMEATLVDLTPSVARLIDPSTVPRLRTLILAGEAVSETDIMKWWGRVQLINAYGPAECNISTISCSQISPKDVTSIGKAVGSTAWIVDPGDYQTLIPLGMIGELLIEGPIVGQGYLGDVEQTACSFIEDPLWLLEGLPGQPGRRGRLYKTGDLVRYNKDGNLMFIGRKDTQVKILGQRVELNEVESIVKECVKEATQLVAEVITPPSKDASPVLAVFVLLDNGVKHKQSESRNFSKYSVSAGAEREIAERLPKHMTPGLFLFMNELPMTNTGKIDRKSLREASASVLSASDASSGLSSLSLAEGAGRILDNEQPAYMLAEKVFSMLPLWRKPVQYSGTREMNKDQLGFEDLFLLPSGLDSVNIMTLMYFISQEFKVKVSMHLLLDTKTSIRTVAKVISETRTAESSILTGSVFARSPASVDLMAEINSYDQDIANLQMSLSRSDNPDSHSTASEPSSLNETLLTVLLTGANGFVGTHVLCQLLTNSQVGTVIAVVRGKTVDIARSRTIKSAKRALWWTESYNEKLQVWPGDLSLPKLGVHHSHWETITDGVTIDAIIQNGAVVHWGKGYEALKATNVGSTIDLLSVSLTAPKMTFVYVTGGRTRVRQDEEEEDIVKELTSQDTDGYGQTKYVAEAVVKRAALRCQSTRTSITIVSPGLIVGTPSEGIPNMDDYIWRLVAACVRIGSYNADYADSWLPMSDAATVAKTIVNTAMRATPTLRSVTRVEDGITWRGFWACIEEVGYQLQASSRRRWLTALRQDLNAGRETHPLWPVAYMFEIETPTATDKDTEGQLETDATSESLRLAIRNSAETLRKIGFLSPPRTLSGCPAWNPRASRDDRERWHGDQERGHFPEHKLEREDGHVQELRYRQNWLLYGPVRAHERVADNILDKSLRVFNGKPGRRTGHNFARIGVPKTSFGPILEILKASFHLDSVSCRDPHLRRSLLASLRWLLAAHPPPERYNLSSGANGEVWFFH